MAHDKGLIQIEEIPHFRAWLAVNAIGFNAGIGQWEVLRVNYGTHVQIIARNSQDHLKTPEGLRPLLQEYRRHVEGQSTASNIAAEIQSRPDAITDTERLDFMLDKSRKLVYEVVGYSGRGTSFIDVYVEQGFMSDRKFDAVRIEVQSSDKCCAPETKREAIDLAIIEVRSECNEKGN